MEVIFQELKVKMYLDRHTERSHINQALEKFKEVLIMLLTLNTNQCSNKNIFSIAQRHMKQLLK